MADLIDTINSKVSNIAGQTGSGTNYGIKKRAPVVPAQTTPVPMSVNTIGPVKPTAPIVKSTSISAPLVAPVTNNVVTGNKLAPVTPTVLPEQVKDNTPSNLSNAVTSDAMAGVDTYTQELNAIKNRDTSGDTVANLMKSISGVQTSEDTLANQLGKDTNLAEYNRLASELELEKNNARRQIEDIQKSNPTGALRGGQLDQIANIERDSARKQGDLAFEANARLGAYDKAISIAKKQVEMEVAPLKAELDRLQYLQDYNKEFRTAEIDAVKLKKQNQIKREEDRLNESNKLILNAIQSKAPQSIIDEAKKLQREGKSVTDIVSTLGSYSVDPEKALDLKIKQQSLIKSINENNATGTTINPKILNTTQFKNAQAAQNLKLTLQKAIDAVKLYGNKEKLSGTGKGILDSIKVQLRSEISTALEQGVVVPGEAAAFDSIAGQINDSYFIRNSKTLASLNSLKNSMDGRIALQKSALTNTYNVKPDQVDLLLNVTDISDQEFADMDAQIQ